MAGSVVTRVTPIDDDGTGTTGTIWNAAYLGTSIYDKIDQLLAGGAGYNPLVLGGGVSVEGGQVVFPAVQNASANVNTLDDYEEGSWTPTIISSGGGTPTYTTQVGRYVKVGRLVKYWGRVILATKGSLATGSVQISSLPITADATVSLFGFTSIPFFAAMTTNVVSLSGYVNGTSSAIVLQMLTAAGVATANVAVADISATVDIIFGGSYMAAN